MSAHCLKELNVLDGETATIGGGRRLRWSGVFAGQVLEFFETPLLLFEQTVLTFADQVGFAGVGAAQADSSGERQSKAKHNRAVKAGENIFDPSTQKVTSK